MLGLDLLDTFACVEVVEMAQVALDVADTAPHVAAAAINWTAVRCEDHDNHDRCPGDLP